MIVFVVVTVKFGFGLSLSDSPIAIPTASRTSARTTPATIRPGRRRRRVVLDGRAGPALRVAVGRGELVERVRLPDALAQLADDDGDLVEQALVAPGVAALGLEPAMAVFPFLADERRRRLGHGDRH
jgi:hypothetical protein